MHQSDLYLEYRINGLPTFTVQTQPLLSPVFHESWILERNGKFLRAQSAAKWRRTCEQPIC